MNNSEEKENLEYETSDRLIAYANNFLDNIEDINKTNIDKMEYLIEKMTNYGFKNPFKPIITKLSDIELSADNKRDIKRQIKIMREEYLMKKNTLRRMRVAYASHRIAVHITNTGYLREIIEHLPIRGEYIKKIASFDIYAYDAYLRLMDFLGTSGMHETPSVMIKLKRIEGNREIIENFKLINPHNIEERIKAIYGNSAEILGTRFINPEYKLIKGAEYRIALATALISWAVNQNMITNKQTISKKSILDKYHDILAKYGISKYYRIDLIDGYEEIKEELVKNSLGFYQEEEFFLNEEVWRTVEAEKNNLATNTFTKAKNLVQQYLIEYLTANQQTNFMPNFALNMPDAYAAVFTEFNYNNITLNIGSAVKEFIELKKYGLFENKLLFGALCVKNGIDKHISAELFGVNLEDLDKTVHAISTIDINKLREFHETK